MNNRLCNWERALREYRYSVDLTMFADKSKFPGCFDCNLTDGHRLQTITFEDRFRNRAEYSIEVWFEVIYWKMFSQGDYRRNHRTRALIQHVERSGISARDLWAACRNYTDAETRVSFDAVRKLLGFRYQTGVATTATFIAFLQPDRFPMVDTRIAKWVGWQLEHSQFTASQLVRPKFLDSKETVIQMHDFGFVEAWIKWCRNTATLLSQSTAQHWRSRDVEMAVFRAWGDRGNGILFWTFRLWSGHSDVRQKPAGEIL